ncbi:putative cytochrome P450 hydroxylase [Enhygromyxa salina]|uniref:Putative cytochrome P450 hydroxylase n=1 Tax=Enhygromyxa salina TaxID=215803 RepID=A0A0C2DCH4_9BACT|nr:cytochrome P450 [Enhygromyxa salina]KIG19135.1 putative cytochrome P450 hydroxylase [Enhygromyxa salina]
MHLSDPDTYIQGMPHDHFEWLRTRDPVSWQPEGYWAVTRHADVAAVLRTPSIFSSWRGGVRFEDPAAEFLDRLRESMLNQDPPGHTRLRQLVSRAFTPRRLRELDTQIQNYARNLVQRAQGECDFAQMIAGEMPLTVICDVLGVPKEDRHELYGLTEQLLSSEESPETVRAAAMTMRAYSVKLAGQRGRSELVDELLGAGLTDGEFQAFFMLLFLSGSDTTRSLLCYGLDLLLDRPKDIERLRADRSLLPAAIEEMLRYEPPVIHFRRTAACDTVLGGKSIAEGDKVLVFFPAANRDEEVFPHAERFDITRSPNPQLSFGMGPHHCLGAALARMEARHVLDQMLNRRWERRGNIESLRSNFVRGVRSLTIHIA